MKIPGLGIQANKECSGPGGPESLTLTPSKDCKALAVHQVWCVEGSLLHESCQEKLSSDLWSGLNNHTYVFHQEPH